MKQLPPKYKNILLVLTTVLGMASVSYFGSGIDVRIAFFYSGLYDLSQAIMFYDEAICYIILTYCLVYPKGINKRIAKWLFYISVLHLVHIITLGGQGFGLAKLLIAAIMVFGNELLRFIKYIIKWRH